MLQSLKAFDLTAATLVAIRIESGFVHAITLTAVQGCEQLAPVLACGDGHVGVCMCVCVCVYVRVCVHVCVCMRVLPPNV